MRARVVIAGVLVVCTVASAVAVVYSKHRSRRLFVELQSLERERDQLNVEWGRLRLEQGTWATPGRVEQAAREQLNMKMPERGDVVVVRVPAPERSATP